MALVTDLEPKELAFASRQKRVDATYSAYEPDGERYFQIDTYGSADRELVGKRSQSLRFNRNAANVLVTLLKQEFDL